MQRTVEGGEFSAMKPGQGNEVGVREVLVRQDVRQQFAEAA